MTKHENSKLMGCSSKRDVYTSNRQPNCTPETTGKIITKKPIEATETEKKNNSRSKSAKLRVFEGN